MSVSVDENLVGILGADLILRELRLSPSSDEGEVFRGSKHLRAADAATDFYDPVSQKNLCLRTGTAIPRASFSSLDLDMKTAILSIKYYAKGKLKNEPRKPDSKATEKHELSALNDADRAKGPEDESRIGRVFILETWRSTRACSYSSYGRGCRR